MPSVYPILKWQEFIKLTRNVEGYVILAIQLRILLSENECPICHKNMDRVRELRKKDGFIWHCEGCKKSLSSQIGIGL